MSTNEKGSYRTTKANAMRAFDQLPPKTREALPRQHYAGHLYDAALDDWRLYYQRKYRRRLRRQYRLSRGEGKRLRAAWTPEDSSKAVMRHGENPRAYGDLWLGGAIPVCVLLVRVGWSRWRIIADAVDPERWRTRGTT